MLSGSKPGWLSAFVETVNPVLVEDVPSGKQWLHEVKFDGYRMQARIDRGTVTITSRRQLDWTPRFPSLAKAFAALPVETIMMDGEVVSVIENGASDFGQLQADLSAGRHDRIVYFAFDLLFLDGFDLTVAPLIERKRVLKAFLEEAEPERIFYSEHFENGADLFKRACDLGLEGVISKKANSTYKPSKSAWLKVKCHQTDELAIIGYVPSGRAHISALRLGKRNGGVFDYVGKVGTGFSQSVSEQLRKQLDQMLIAKPALSARLRKPDTRWVRPDLKARVAFRGITSEGKLRHPSFKGLVQIT